MMRCRNQAALFTRLVCVLAGVVLLLPGTANAAQQFAGLCAFVKMEIAQELTMERIGFLATLEITNNEGDANITSFSAELSFSDFNTGEDASDRFFIQPPQLRGISGVDGSGILRPGETGVIEWFIIPKIAAGGVEPTGMRYNVGAQLAGQIYGLDIDPAVLAVIPDTISVLPDPQLEITYFQPRDVDGDDPFTPEVEAPIPFTLGVLVNNVGAGQANSVQIASEQPRIIDNQQALVLVAQLLGSRVDDALTDQTSLTVDLGNIAPGSCRKGAWDMITSLSGQFIEFNARYTHAPELGGRDTSLITSLDAHFIVHEVLNDQPGRDNIKDFLADTILAEAEDTRARDIIPDTLFETDCNTLPVNQLVNVEVVSNTGLTTVIDAVADFENWVYLRVDDPAQGRFKIAGMVRSDGKVLNENNYWINTRYGFTDNKRFDFINIFDFVALGNYTYTLTYEAPAPETDPPVTRLRFVGQVEDVGGQFYISPETQLYFTVDDVSPVSIFYKESGDADFLPGLPFFIDEPGTHIIEYFSRDSFNNEETHQFATIVLSADFPTVANLVADTSELFIPGDSLSVRPDNATISFDAANPATTTDASVRVYRGVYAFPTLSGVPSTPTVDTLASITVAGENVDFYRYRLNGGLWSVEFPVTQLIDLAGLGGSNTLEVMARSQFAAYGPDDVLVSAAWGIDGGADSVRVLTPESPNNSTAASLDITSDTGFYCYRVDGTFYQPEPAGGAPIVLTGLSEAQHGVEVLTRPDAGTPCPGDIPGNAVSWLVDRAYGFDLPMTALVREESFPDIGAATVNYTWDARDETGAVVEPGYYSLEVSLTDSLGRITSAMQIVRIGDLLTDGSAVADVPGAEQKEPHARGRWLVWQDQRNNNWDIFALDLTAAGAMPLPITNNSLNQESPRTDGEFAVWQDRQPDGNWDIWMTRLGSAEPVAALTQTPEFDERHPSIDWPWVVFERTPVADPDAPAQLVSYNVVTDTFADVDPSSQDQLNPAVHAGRVVWQDMRDAGAGEIYFKDLESVAVMRITDNPGAQIQPDIFQQWIVWADNRNGLQLDLYGYNLKRGVEVQMTSTAQDEARPDVNGDWVVYTDDSSGAENQNLRLLHLSSFASVQLTNFASPKDKPGMASGKLVWGDRRTGENKIRIATIPDLQPVFNNRNTVAVTAGLAQFQNDAFSLLRRWNDTVSVAEITRYTTLLPTPVAETAVWNAGSPGGVNFPLNPGSFLWVKFDSEEILDLGNTACDAIDLVAGVNAFGFSCFPDHYSAYQVLRDLDTSNVRSIRVLDSASGNWSVATFFNNQIVGEDFPIAKVAVLLIEMNTPVAQWTPGGN